MGRTYASKSKLAKGRFGDKDFDVNYSGADILGEIMLSVGEHSKSLEEVNKKFGDDNLFMPSTRFKMTKKECIDAAKKLEALPDKERNAVFEKCKNLVQDSKREYFDGIFKEWVEFLRTCGGYEVY